MMRLAVASVAVTLLFGLLGGPLRADPLRVRSLIEEVQAFEDSAKAVETNAATVSALAALGEGSVLDITPFLMDSRREVRLVAIAALARIGSSRGVDALLGLLDHTDEVTAAAAVDALGAIGAPRVAGALRTIVKRTSPAPAPPLVRQAAIRALPLTHDPKARDFILPLIQALPSPEDTAAIVLALARVGDPTTLDAIRPLLADPNRRVPALDALAPFGEPALVLLGEELDAHPDDAQAKREIADAALLFGATGLPIIERLLGSGDRDLDLHILRGLASVKPRGPVDTLLRRQLSDRDPEYVVVAAQQLGDDHDTEALSAFLKLLKHDAVEVRLAAAEALGKLAAPSSVNPLTFALTREMARRQTVDNLALRRKLLWALGELRSDAAVPTFIGALDVPDQREAAMSALVLAGRSAIRTLVLIIKSGDKEREPEAVEAILRIGQAAGRDVATLLTHPSSAARELGLQLTAAVGDESAIPMLTRMVLDVSSPHRYDALRVLSLFYTPELHTIFRKAYEKGDLRMKKLVLRSYWRHGDLQAADILKGVAEDGGEPELRRAAVWGIYFLGLAAGRDLFSRMLDYETATVKAVAIDALGLGANPRAIPRLAKYLPLIDRELVPSVRRAIRRLMRYQGAPKKAPDASDWYDDNDDDFPNFAVALRDAGSDDEASGDEADDGSSWVGTEDGQTLRYTVSGDEDDPAVIAIADGPDGDSSLLRRGLGELADDFRLVTYDGRGRGRSRGAAPWASYSLNREAQDLETLREHLGLAKVSLIGHGFGALIAIRYAATYPERVDRVVLLNAPYPVAAAVAGRSDVVHSRLAGDAREALLWIEARAGYSPRAVFNARWGYYALPAYFHDTRRANRYRAPDLDPSLREELLDRLGDFNIEDAFVTIRRPVFVLLTGDDMYPDETQSRWERLLSLKPGERRLRTLSGVGHYSFLERQDDTIDAVSDFLEGD